MNNDMETSGENQNHNEIPNKHIKKESNSNDLRPNKNEDQMEWSKEDGEKHGNKDGSNREIKKEGKLSEIQNFNLRPAHHNSKSQNISVGTIQRFKNININGEENGKSMNPGDPNNIKNNDELSANSQNQGQFSLESLLS